MGFTFCIVMYLRINTMLGYRLWSYSKFRKILTYKKLENVLMVVTTGCFYSVHKKVMAINIFLVNIPFLYPLVTHWIFRKCNKILLFYRRPRLRCMVRKNLSFVCFGRLVLTNKNSGTKVVFACVMFRMNCYVSDEDVGNYDNT